MSAPYRVTEAFIATYGDAGVRTLKIIIKYLKWREERYGRKSVCVSYEGLRKYITFKRIGIKFTTLERAIRKLAEGEDAPLKRKRVGRNAVIFCLNTEHPMVTRLMEVVSNG